MPHVKGHVVRNISIMVLAEAFSLKQYHVINEKQILCRFLCVGYD